MGNDELLRPIPITEQEFGLRERLLYSTEQLRDFRDRFTTELTLASLGEPSSLSYIENPIPSPRVQDGERFQAIVVGGTNYQTAILRREGNTLIQESLQEGSLPTITNRDVFLRFMTDHIDPDVSVVSANFAYPLNPVSENGKLDGRLREPRKEHPFEGVVGKQIGTMIEEHIARSQNGRTIEVSSANDTICLGFLGLEHIDPDADNLAAGVVGTGLNFAIKERNMLINLESGSSQGFDPTPTGVIIDAESENPGVGVYEKDVSGGYLYKHYNLLKSDLGIETENLTDSDQLTKLSQLGGLSKESQLAQTLLRRSASLVAVQIAGIYAFKNQESLTLAIEGGMFWKGHEYKDMVQEYLLKLGVPYGKVNLVEIKNSGIAGAAKLAASDATFDISQT